MKKFWMSIAVLLVLILGYQLMKSTQLTAPGSTDITGAVQHYVSDTLGVEFDYLDHVDNEPVLVIESGNILLIGSSQAGFQSMQVLDHDPAQTLEAFVKKLLTGVDKRCSFEFKAGNYLSDTHAQQLIVANTSPWKYLGQGEEIAPGAEGTICKSLYDTQEGLKFFAFDVRTSDSVYFFSLGEGDPLPGTVDLRTPWYQTLKFLATGDVLAEAGIGPIADDSTGHINLIKTYYKAIQGHDFVAAASRVASGENDAAALQSKYSNVVEMVPFKIEQVGDKTCHFYVSLLDAGATQPSIYSLKKTVVDGKLKSVSGGKIVTNASTDQFRYYSDQFIDVTIKTFKVSDLLNAEDLMKSDCARPATKDLAYFKKLLSVFDSQSQGTKYTISFKNLENIREPLPGGSEGKQSASVYVVANAIKYPSKTAFFEDFDKCAASTKYVPFLITLDWMIFVDGCGKQDKGYCNAIKNMLRQTIKVK